MYCCFCGSRFSRWPLISTSLSVLFSEPVSNQTINVFCFVGLLVVLCSCPDRRHLALAVLGLMSGLTSRLATAVLLGLLSVFLLGVLSLLMGSVAVELTEPHLAGTASGKSHLSSCIQLITYFMLPTGVINATQYLGSGLGSVVIGHLLQRDGWGIWPLSMVPGMLIAIAADLALMRALHIPAAVSPSPLPRQLPSRIKYNRFGV